MLSGSSVDTAGEKGCGDTHSAIPSNASGRPCQCVIIEELLPTQLTAPVFSCHMK